MTDLSKKPFYLSAADIAWVQAQLDGMTLDEKIGQLFCMVGYGKDETYLSHITRDLKVGGLMCRAMPQAEIMDSVRIIQEHSKVPMLVSANLEAGGNGLALEGTPLGYPMAVAATDEVEMAYKLGVVCGRESAALGGNWAFAPIVDIDYCFRNPITNTRTFGAEAERVARMGCAYIKGVQENGVAATVKHFPGDGVDERDQHLVTSINSLSCEEWDRSYGMVYRQCIEAGAMAIMAGHIAQPAYSRKLCPGIKDEAILPASLSYELITVLLKEQLGFNGLVTTDATAMAGMLMAMPRSEAVPTAIAAGCDVFLFTRNMEEDFGYMKAGLENGILSATRLDAAVTKILALKAALKLHDKQQNGQLFPDSALAEQVVGCAEHRQWAHECASKSITLVKEEPGVLPLRSEKTPRVLLYGLETGDNVMGFGATSGVLQRFQTLLEQEGFEVELFTPPQGMEGLMASWEEFIAKYDLLIYLANLATKSNQTIVRIEWAAPMGANVPIYVSQVPTVFISLENPYHLLDAPRVKTYINTYGSSEIVLEELVNKLTGRSAFMGKSPVDAFCGKWDTRL